MLNRLVEFSRLKWFFDIAVRPALLRDSGDIFVGRKHEYGNVGRRSICFNKLTNRPSINSFHLYIQQDHVRRRLGNNIHDIFPIWGNGCIVSV